MVGRKIEEAGPKIFRCETVCGDGIECEREASDGKLEKTAKRAFVGAGARVLFYPTLLYNVVRNKLQPEFRWWDQIDQAMLLLLCSNQRKVAIVNITVRPLLCVGDSLIGYQAPNAQSYRYGCFEGQACRSPNHQKAKGMDVKTFQKIPALQRVVRELIKCVNSEHISMTISERRSEAFLQT